MIIIEKFNNIFIKIIAILIILVIIIYNFFINKNETTEFDSFNIVVENTAEIPEETPVASKIKIYVTGEVNSPGVIELEENSRIEDAIRLAGGITSSANLANVNLAFVLEDGQKLYIPNINETEVKEYISVENGSNIIESSGKSKNSKININKATIEDLKTLPGVGESLANRIITYRTETGNFKAIEDLKNVSGIGEKKFESLKEFITI